ncbi:MAG: DUF2889 domain-containing protein [Alphaproteobacteria bacterium]|nr:DUF2889 domain-containing protein [Alphaproteobacteria bacterium]
MPLSPPAERKYVHRRAIDIRGYERADGLWDIEGHLVDTKTYGFDNRDRGRVEPGAPVHEMWLRITIDTDMMIHAAEASTEYGPYAMCGAITPNYAKLKGIRIGPGWRRQVREVVGGIKGCTHLVELLGPLATTAYQTIWPALSKKQKDENRASGKQPAIIGSCHAYATDSPVVKRNWPEHYTGP